MQPSQSSAITKQEVLVWLLFAVGTAISFTFAGAALTGTVLPLPLILLLFVIGNTNHVLLNRLDPSGKAASPQIVLNMMQTPANQEPTPIRPNVVN